MRLEGRTAVITGAASGIGRETALLFGSEGAAVACVDLSGERAEETAAAVVAAGGQASAYQADVTDAARIDAVFDEVAAAHGPCTALVTSAGVAGLPDDGGDGSGGVSILGLTDHGFLRMLEIHLGGMMYASRAAVRQMHDAAVGGSIVGLSSIAGLAGMGGVHYATAKGGVLGFVRSLAREIGPMGIRINAICPGVIDTPMTQAVPSAMIEPMVAATPMRRIGVAADIASAALYLTSDESSFVTGQWLSPNGGIHIG